MPTETLVADSIAAQANFSPTVVLADIDDDPASPDGTWALWDGNGDSALTVTLPSPSGDLTVGADLQTFRVLIRRDSGSGTNSVDWSVRLIQSGAFRATLASGTTTSDSGETVSGTWNANLLVSDPAGDDVEIEILQTGGGTGGPTTRRGLEVDGFAWDVDYQAAVVVGTVLPSRIKSMAHLLNR